MVMDVEAQKKLRKIAALSDDYFAPMADWPRPIAIMPKGYSDSTLTLWVNKKSERFGFAADQAVFMSYLGEQVCPKILAMNHTHYCMEYLNPAQLNTDSLLVVENLLEEFVWYRNDSRWVNTDEYAWRYSIYDNLGVDVPNWALGPHCVIHGDPTCDNMLVRDTELVITDPIPPQWLNKPSIVAVDHGKILQSFLGWETVLRGIPLKEYTWPKFMYNNETARRAVFWAMIAIKRIAFRNMTPRITTWAKLVAEELDKLCT
jgi:hypothetical protein